jgi:hypothetical protein
MFRERISLLKFGRMPNFSFSLDTVLMWSRRGLQLALGASEDTALDLMYLPIRRIWSLLFLGAGWTE